MDWDGKSDDVLGRMCDILGNSPGLLTIIMIKKHFGLSYHEKVLGAVPPSCNIAGADPRTCTESSYKFVNNQSTKPKNGRCRIGSNSDNPQEGNKSRTKRTGVRSVRKGQVGTGTHLPK